MSSLDIYRKNIERKNAELIRLQQDKAKEFKKIAECSGKINSARQAMSRTSSTSTIKSKLSEIERYSKVSVR